MHMSWRLASRLSVITLAVLVAVVVAVISTRADQQAANPVPSSAFTKAGLQGTDMGGVPAPNFALTDQNGKQISLAQFKGEPVIVTFLYTHCPDACPLTAEKLRQMVANLGSAAQHIAIIAVSVDPKRDTHASVINFSQAHGLLSYSNWHYLTGTQAQLSPIWSNYNVYAAAAAAASTSGSVSHTTALYLLDKQGHERAFFSDEATAASLTTDMQILLKQ